MSAFMTKYVTVEQRKKKISERKAGLLLVQQMLAQEVNEIRKERLRNRIEIIKHQIDELELENMSAMAGMEA